ncbi:MAG: SpoIID/LytB domain-containing protein, partial [Lachnospiraceae bacterium]|nr:SpoIID/LytB domain-containing protein [Lachnospiraceae bacterium]
RLARWEEVNREAYWNNILIAVNETAGKIITYDGKPINAFFHASSGGVTEIPINVWGGGEAYPYLQAVATSGEDAYSQYSSETIATKQEVIDKIKAYHSDIQIDFSLENEVQILEYTEGTRVKTIKFGNLNLSGVETRTIFGLRSANFTVEIDGDNVKFSVKGYGHGVGMSQTGADSLAKQGQNYEDIIKHFYVGTEIINM